LKDSALLIVLVLLFVAILLSVTGELLLKHGVNQLGVLELHSDNLVPVFIRVFTNPFVLLGFIFLFGGSIFWLSMISRVPLSYAYPMLSTSYILVLGASWLFLGEQINPVQIIGVLVIMLGVSLVFWSNQ
ncbi:MAG TPA: EamA family transporter, partial [Candidatus Saccharimonadales bacterium]|nr:EamA family transporter [Candidatus Saccharimonadales bacterium]